MATIQSDLTRMLTEAGAVLCRSKRHQIWRLGSSQIVVSSSPSSKRVLHEVRAFIRRAEKG